MPVRYKDEKVQWQGIMKLKKFCWKRSTAEHYRVACDCMDSEHDLCVEVEHNKDLDTLQLTFYANITAADWYGQDLKFFEKIKWRIKTAMKILTRGEVEQQHDFIFMDEEQIKDLIGILEEGIEKIHQDKEDYKREKKEEK